MVTFEKRQLLMAIVARADATTNADELDRPAPYMMQMVLIHNNII
jgi:hypothetical protein